MFSGRRFYSLKKMDFVMSVFLLGQTLQAASMGYDEAWVESTMQSLSLQQKIGQLFVVAARFDDNAKQEDCSDHARFLSNGREVEMLITEYGVGGVIFLGKKSLTEGLVHSIKTFQQRSIIPLLMTLDAEWGLGMRLCDAIAFPRNNVLGREEDETVYRVAHEIGRQLRCIGMHMNFAPVADVNNNPKNPVIGSRSFGDDPGLVAGKSIAFMQGLHHAGILACAKHFPGHGDTNVDSHLALPLIPHDKNRLQSVEFHPFVELVKNGVPAIMMAHLEVPALEPEPRVPTSLSHTVINNVLRGELGFTGLVITDALDMKGVTSLYEPGDAELRAFLAGNDILLVPTDVPKAVDLIERAIKEGRVSEQNLDARVRKIMATKAWALFKNPESLNPVYQHEELHTPGAYALLEQLTQSSRE